MRRADGNSQEVYEVIIVLGAAVWPQGQPSPALRSRMTHAIHAWQAGRGKHLLVTGGLGVHPPAEAHVMRQLACAAGVPAGHIWLDDQSVSTWQSAVHCTRLMRRHGWSKALVVTDRLHLPRALLAFRGLGVQAVGSAPLHMPYAGKRWKRWRYLGRERLAFVWYLLFITIRGVRCPGRQRTASDASDEAPPNP